MPSRAWSALHAALAEQAPLRVLANQAERCQALRVDVGALHAELGKQPWDVALLAAASVFSEQVKLRQCIADLFEGKQVNASEQRPALHTLLRRRADVEAGPLTELQVQVRQTLERMRTLVNTLRTGRAAELGLAPTTDVVNIGIGGSDLGPRLVAEALASSASPLQVHFVSNVDAHEFTRLLARLNPATTLFVIASKSFNTQETLLNASMARLWLKEQGIVDSTAHFIAVSANVAAAEQFGIARQHIYPMWDWVGGRYSIWSAVGISAALAIGMPAFEALLAGAETMDEHFRSAPWSANLPWLLAWTGVIHRNLLNRASYAVVPYDQRLRLLPAYLQQLEMESLGKSVGPDGQAVEHATSPVLLPGLGTDAQHAFFQALHQGTEVVPVDFVGVLRPDHSESAQHEVLLSHLFAQSAALLRGRSLEEARQTLTAVADPVLREIGAAQRVFPGNRPSTTLLLERLDAHALGSLLALYEHKVYVQSVLWGINAFDQWGVELGKQIAAELLPLLRVADPDLSTLDQSTQYLIAHARRVRVNGPTPA